MQTPTVEQKKIAADEIAQERALRNAQQDAQRDAPVVETKDDRIRNPSLPPQAPIEKVPGTAPPIGKPNPSAERAPTAEKVPVVQPRTASEPRPRDTSDVVGSSPERVRDVVRDDVGTPAEGNRKPIQGPDTPSPVA